MKVLALIPILALASCADLPLPGGGSVSGTPGFFKEALPSDPEARFGVLVVARRGEAVLPQK